MFAPEFMRAALAYSDCVFANLSRGAPGGLYLKNMDKIRLENLIFFYASVCSESVFSKGGKLSCLSKNGFLPFLLRIYNIRFSAENGRISREDSAWEKREWRKFCACYMKERRNCPPAPGVNWQRRRREGMRKNLSSAGERF